MKKCIWCHIEKPISEFSISYKKNRDYRCLMCVKIYQRGRSSVKAGKSDFCQFCGQESNEIMKVCFDCYKKIKK